MFTYDSELYRYAVDEDLPLIFDMLSDPEVGRWLWFMPAPFEAVRAYFAPFLRRQRAQLERGETPASPIFTVLDRDGTFLGQGAAVAVEGSPGGFEIGYQLRGEAWGRGVGSRLARFLCAYVVHCSRAYRIEASCLEGNVASRRILRGLGLKPEGVRPEYRLKERARHTELLFGAPVAELDLGRFSEVADRTGLREVAAGA